MKGRIYENTTGQLVDGLFYAISAHPASWYSHSREILRNASTPHYAYTVAVAEKVESHSSRGCPYHSVTNDEMLLRYLCVSLHGQPSNQHIIGGLDGHILVQTAVIDQVRRSGLSLRAICPHIIVDDASPAIDEFRAICFDGRSMRRSLAVFPPDANRCTRCGCFPIVCQICADMKYTCPQCGMRMICIGDGDAPLQYVPDHFFGPVLSFSEWDGSHFVGGKSNIVTGTALDVLLMLDVRPLYAYPLRCYVGDADKTRYEWLRSKEEQK